MVTICTTSLTFNNSTFCPHSAFMCFVWISEQTAIISLRVYIINPLNAELNTICHLLALLGAHLIFHVSRIRANWLVFITETECVYCAVRTGCLYVIQFNVSPSARCQLPVCHCGSPCMWNLWSTEWHWEQLFAPSTSVLPRQYHSTSAVH